MTAITPCSANTYSLQKLTAFWQSAAAVTIAMSCVLLSVVHLFSCVRLRGALDTSQDGFRTLWSREAVLITEW